jgi:hypothetical protein
MAGARGGRYVEGACAAMRHGGVLLSLVRCRRAAWRRVAACGLLARGAPPRGVAAAVRARAAPGRQSRRRTRGGTDARMLCTPGRRRPRHDAQHLWADHGNHPTTGAGRPSMRRRTSWPRP